MDNYALKGGEAVNINVALALLLATSNVVLQQTKVQLDSRFIVFLNIVSVICFLLIVFAFIKIIWLKLKPNQDAKLSELTIKLSYLLNFTGNTDDTDLEGMAELLIKVRRSVPNIKDRNLKAHVIKMCRSADNILVCRLGTTNPSRQKKVKYHEEFNNHLDKVLELLPT